MEIRAQLACRVLLYKISLKVKTTVVQVMLLVFCIACADDCCDGVTGDWCGQVSAHTAAKSVT